MPSVREVPGCAGCPFRKRGGTFVPDEIRNGAAVLVCGQNPGKEEEAQARPFVGKTGAMQEKSFLPLAGLTREDVSIANTLRCRLDGSDKLPELTGKGTEECQQAIQHCTQAHFKLPESTKVIVAQGGYALWMLTGESGVQAWRGWGLPLAHPWMGKQVATDIWVPRPGIPIVLATMHLAALFREPLLTMPTKRDWAKVRRILNGKWPVPLARIQADPPRVWPALSAFDTEYVVETRRLLRYNLCDAASGDLFVVEALDGHVEVVRGEGRPSVILHNAEADLDYLDKLLEPGSYDVEDTMYLDAVLWSGLPHDLGFLGSLYGSTNRWKHLAYTNPRVYAAADARVTVDVFNALSEQLKRDPETERAYRERRLPLIPIIRRARQYGARVHQERAQRATLALAAQQDDATEMAQAATGWPINIGSPSQVSDWLYEQEGMPQGRKR